MTIGSALSRAALVIGAFPHVAGALPAQLPDSVAHEQAARLLLRRLAGQWSFEVRTANGVGATGTRQYTILSDSLRVVWNESSTGAERTGHGALWYDPRAQRFFYFGLYAPPVAAMLLTGRLASSGTTVTFDLLPVASDSIPLNEGLVRSRLHVADSKAHVWARWDNAWVVTFRPRHGAAVAPGNSQSAAPEPFSRSFTDEIAMIRKLKNGQYRLYSRKKNPKTGKRRNLGTFRTRAAAEKHERAVQFFKRGG